MNPLLDPRPVWQLEDSPRPSGAAKAAIADISNTVMVSAASGGEIATKHCPGKLSMSDVVVRDLPAQDLG